MLYPYAKDLAQIRLIDCGQELGALSNQSRNALTDQFDTIDNALWYARSGYGRLWVIGQSSPLDASCFANQIAPLIQGKPIFPMDSNQYISSGVWLVTK